MAADDSSATPKVADLGRLGNLKASFLLRGDKIINKIVGFIEVEDAHGLVVDVRLNCKVPLTRLGWVRKDLEQAGYPGLGSVVRFLGNLGRLGS